MWIGFVNQQFRKPITIQVYGLAWNKLILKKQNTTSFDNERPDQLLRYLIKIKY